MLFPGWNKLVRSMGLIGLFSFSPCGILHADVAGVRHVGFIPFLIKIQAGGCAKP